MAKSRYSISRLEKLLGKTLRHREGSHLKVGSWHKTNPSTRGRVMNQKGGLALALQSRINGQRMRGGR